MKNFCLMVKTMICGLFSYGKFEDREEFWEWYWEQIPDARYPGETLWDAWDTFKHYATGQHIIWEVRMWYEYYFNKKNYGYSWTFNKNGYFINNNHWFVPSDKSFQYGTVDSATEYRNGNPYFTKN